MDHRKIQESLSSILRYMHEAFPENADRILQLDRHMATVRMVIDHIHEEAARAAGGKS